MIDFGPEEFPTPSDLAYWQCKANEVRGFESLRRVGLEFMGRGYKREEFTLADLAKLDSTQHHAWMCVQHLKHAHGQEANDRPIIKFFAVTLDLAEKEFEAWRLAHFLYAACLSEEVKLPREITLRVASMHLRMAWELDWSPPPRKQGNRGFLASVHVIRALYFFEAHRHLEAIGIKPAPLRHEIIGEFSKDAFTSTESVARIISQGRKHEKRKEMWGKGRNRTLSTK